MLLVLTSTLMGWLFSSSRAYLALNRKKSISSAAASISAWMTVLPCQERPHQIKALRGGGGRNAAAMSRSGAARRIQMRFVGCPSHTDHVLASKRCDLLQAPIPPGILCTERRQTQPVPGDVTSTRDPPQPPLGKSGLLGRFARVNPDNHSPHQLILFS